MKCQICGCTSLPGTKLCPDCRAARQRAFDATVTQPLLAAGTRHGSRASPRLLRPGRSLSDASRRAARHAQAANAPLRSEAVLREIWPPLAVGRWPLAVAGLVLVLIAGAYAAQRFGAAMESAASMQSAQEPSARDAPTETRVKSSATENSSAPPTAAQTPSPTPAEDPLLKAIPSASSETPKRQNIRARPAPPVAAVVATEPPPVIQSVAAPPPPPIVSEAPRPDPWQQMNDALARCAREDISGRLMCEHRVRLQHCDGRWGQVPQCASIPYIDHGQ